MLTTEQEQRLSATGQAAFAAILEMVQNLRAAEEDENNEAIEKARTEIEEDALEVAVRSGWYSPGGEFASPDQFKLLLATGGPAVRIVGELWEGSPSSCKLQVQNWFTPWTDYTQADEEVLLEYASCFYFGD